MNILSSTKTFTGRLRLIGTEGLQDQELIKRISIVNTLSIAFSVLLFLVACIMAVPSGWEWALLLPLLIELLLNNLVLLANHYKQYSLAAHWLFLLQCAAIMYFGNLLGSGVQLQFAVVYLMAMAFLIFPTSLERRFCIACACIALLFLELNLYNNMPGIIKMSSEAGLLLHSVVIVAILCLIMVVSKPYVRSNDTNTALLKADHFKKVFLYQVTHDLKTPLHVMTVAASLLKQELNKKAPSRKTEDLLQQLQAAGINANALVNNVLTMAEIEAGKMEMPEPGSFVVRDFFTNIVHLHKLIAGTRNIKIKLFIDHALPELIISDSLKLNQITTNLLSNAIHYANRNSMVELDVRAHNNKLLIKVSNQGQGISAELQEHLFNPFVTGNCKHRKGTGLGLYIVKMKIMSMGGHICVSSDAEGLTSFTVTLPLQEGEMQEEAIQEKLPSCNPHVLLAGPLQLPQGLQKLPETMGCRVSRAANGNELLDIVSQDLPDVIILDSQLPSVKAEEVLHRLKKNAVLKAIPVLVTATGNQEDSTDEILLAAGADGIIGDRFNYKQLYQALTPYLQSE